MKTSQVAVAAAILLAAAAASAQTSTFANNGGVHEAQEFASDTFQLPTTSLLDKFTFTLASSAGLESDVVSLGRPTPTGTVTLYSDKVVDTIVGSYTFATGTKSFGALAAGDYYYLVSVSGPKGGGFVLGSYVTAVPEPETYALMLAGLAVTGWVARRRA